MATGRRKHLGETPRKHRVLVVLGTRPEAIKLAPLIRRLKRNDAFECRVCVTGQHRSMLGPILRLFGIVPEHSLDAMRPGQTLVSLTSRMLRGLDRVLEVEQPQLVIVQGDTTTTLASAVAAFYRHVPIAHVEAGLRTRDLRNPFPEEANRRLTGSLARWHFAATDSAKENLLREGVPRRSIAVTGNTVVDAVHGLVERISASPRIERQMRSRMPWLSDLGATNRKLILVTAHRRESFGAGIEAICMAVRRIAQRADVEIVWPVHPNPNVCGPVHRLLGNRPRVRLIAAQEYLPFVYLLAKSCLVLTDSGGIQEEAPSLRKPVLILRSVTERPEAIDAGVARLVGTNAKVIVREVQALLGDAASYLAMTTLRNPFGDGNASVRIERALLRWLS